MIWHFSFTTTLKWKFTRITHQIERLYSSKIIISIWLLILLIYVAVRLWKSNAEEHCRLILFSPWYFQNLCFYHAIYFHKWVQLFCFTIVVKWSVVNPVCYGWATGQQLNDLDAPVHLHFTKCTDYWGP